MLIGFNIDLVCILLLLLLLNITVLLLLPRFTVKHIVLKHEEQVKQNGKQSQTKLSGVSEYGCPVICGKDSY